MANKYYGQYKGKRVFGKTPEDVIKEAGGEMPTEFKQFTGDTWQPFSYSPTQQSAEQPDTTSGMGRQIYQQGEDLFYQTGGDYEKIKSPQELKELSSIGFLDTSIGRSGQKYTALPETDIPKSQAGQGELPDEEERLEDIFPEISLEEPIPDTFDATEMQKLLKSGLDDLKSKIEEISSATVPEVPDLSEQYQQLVADKGIPALQESLSKIDEKIKNVKASYQMGVTDVEGKPIPMEAITGQKAQLQKVYNNQIQPLIDERNSIASQIQAKENTIALIMDLEQTDYQNAMARAETLYSRKIDKVNSAMKIFDIEYQTTMDAWNIMSQQQQLMYTVKKDQEQNNQALFSVAFEMAQRSGKDWSQMSSEAKEKIEALSVASGYPVGTAKYLLENVPDSSEVITSAFDNAGNLSIITRSADGSFNVESLGRVGKAETGGGFTDFFTDTQISKGAINAGMGIKEFSNLPVDEANKYIAGGIQKVDISGEQIVANFYDRGFLGNREKNVGTAKERAIESIKGEMDENGKIILNIEDEQGDDIKTEVDGNELINKIQLIEESREMGKFIEEINSQLEE